jgi:acyl-CoA synthetase (NDP forming)
MTDDTPLNLFARPAEAARSDYALHRYRRALLANHETPKGILAVPRKDPARDRALRAVFGPQPER